MRAVAIFFMSLCLLLLATFCFLNTKNNFQGIFSLSALNSCTSPQTNFKNLTASLSLIRNNNSGEKREEFISVENEDDDEELISASKYVLAVRFFIAICSASSLAYFYRCLKNFPAFCNRFPDTSSHKYIKQRALRI